MQSGQTSRQCFFKNAVFPMSINARAKSQDEFILATGMEALC
jgi:hypothetical protein